MIGALLCLLAAPASYEVTWTAPTVFVEGRPYPVHVEFKAVKDGAIAAWMFTQAAVRIDGKPLSDKRAGGDIEFGAGSSFVLDLEIHEELAASKAYARKPFKISFEGADAKPVDVRVFLPAPKGSEFLDEKKTPVTLLAKHFVLLETNRGNLIAELWPDVAPGHVRNFLDLAHTGFYDGTLFHRVWPGFMIQGGDPNTKDPKAQAAWGTGSGPRTLKAEFNARKHVRGVLSMARGGDPNSASCQFFVVHQASPNLDGKYSAFGALIDGLDVVDRIVNAPGITIENGTIRPNEPQRIEHAVVIVAP